MSQSAECRIGKTAEITDENASRQQGTGGEPVPIGAAMDRQQRGGDYNHGPDESGSDPAESGERCALCGGPLHEDHSHRHKQVRVKVGSHEGDVDEELAPLIEELWKAKILTELSCQEACPGIAWIQFSEAEGLCAFLNIVAEFDREAGSLYRRITGPVNGEKDCWVYGLLPWDGAVHETLTEDDRVEESHEGQPDFHPCAAVHFPRSDLPVLLERMTRHNHSFRRRAWR
jgi:hypothetical protein